MHVTAIRRDRTGANGENAYTGRKARSGQALAGNPRAPVRSREEGGMAGPTRLELATSGVTGRRSNQLNYDPAS